MDPSIAGSSYIHHLTPSLSRSELPSDGAMGSEISYWAIDAASDAAGESRYSSGFGGQSNGRR
jgi:hypothetical protein